MCHKVYPITFCDHRGPTRWIRCNNLTYCEKFIGDICQNAWDHRATVRVEHDRRHVRFCCSSACCERDIRRLQAPVDRWEGEEAIPYARERLMEARAMLVKAQRKHSRCRSSRERYLESVRDPIGRLND